MDVIRDHIDAIRLLAEAEGGNTIFVWHGNEVLKNYTSGMVIVAAFNEEAAWIKLKKANFRVWFWLQTGYRHAWDERAAEAFDPAEDHEPGFPLHPRAFSPATLPVLIIHGGE